MTRGFTLLELIIVLVVMAIIAVTAGPRVLGTSGVSEQANRDQLISVLRLMQQQAMQDTAGPCFTLLLTNTLVLPDTASGCSAVDSDSVYRFDAAAEDTSLSLSSLQTAATIALPAQLSFDRLGRPVTYLNGVKLQLSGTVAEAVCIESQGYIHPCD